MIHKKEEGMTPDRKTNKEMPDSSALERLSALSSLIHEYSGINMRLLTDLNKHRKPLLNVSWTIGHSSRENSIRNSLFHFFSFSQHFLCFPIPCPPFSPTAFCFAFEGSAHVPLNLSFFVYYFVLFTAIVLSWHLSQCIIFINGPSLLLHLNLYRTLHGQWNFLYLMY